MISSDKAKKYQTLAIIGNGFDMAHGYHTDYRSFVENTNDPSLEEFKTYCDNDGSIVTWYSFEENIRILTEKLFFQSYNENIDYDANRKEVARLQTVYKEIYRLLIKYLKSESTRKPVSRLASIEEYLCDRTKVINFNYTKIAKAYTNDVFYVHGSLDENDILLGYDYRNEPCLAQYDDMCFSKILCREALAFRRYLQQQCGLKSDEDEYKQLVSELESYQHWDNSGRGIEEEADTFLPNYHFIDRFVREYRAKKAIPDMDYENILTIVVMGHGIEADQAFLKKIVSECVNLQEVIVFRYCGEDEASIEKKMQFFCPYCYSTRYVYY